MDLSTTYMGLKLAHPLMPGASPLADDLDGVRRLEDAGAAAIVLRSLFEEQIAREQMSTFMHTTPHGESFAEALSYFPSADGFVMGPDEYLEHLRKVRAAVKVPVIASLNGTSLGGWLRYAALMEQAGADALELNVYAINTDLEEDAHTLEKRVLGMVRSIKGAVKIPVAVKLSPFYTSVAHFAKRLEEACADGLVLFNRFYQPDIDVEELQTVRSLVLSSSQELPLRLRWLAILSGRLRASLAVSGGVHTHLDAIKAVMAGAHAVQLVSALLKNGPGYLVPLRRELERWLVEHEYESLSQMCGSMSLRNSPDPAAYERGNYMMILQSWRQA
jgi:dihydroorotate dehydrogenase (fumarate)